MTVAVAGQAGMQVHGVRHHRGAQHRAGQKDALGAVEAGEHSADNVAGSGRVDEKACQETDCDDEQQPGDDAFEHALPAPVLDHQQQQ